MSDAAQLGDVLTSPSWLLTSFDAESELLIFTETNLDILTKSAFIDGRTPLSQTGRTAAFELKDARAWLRDAPSQTTPDRIIAHVGWCGSSLLARTLDATGACQTYKEPQVLIELSALKTASSPLARDEEEWSNLVAVVRSQFRKAYDGRMAVLKPSNWPVNLLPDLCAGNARAIFLTSSPLAYMLAILRGGEERRWFLLRFVQNLRQDFPDVERAVSEVERAAGLSKLQRLLRWALIVLFAQERVFAQCRRPMPQHATVTLSGEDFIRCPQEHLSTVAATLGLPLSEAEQRAAIDAAFAFSAKVPSAAFDGAAEAALNRRLYGVHSMDLDQALAWREEWRFA